MKQVLPVVVVCSVGIALGVAYIIFLFVRVLAKKSGKKRTRTMQIEDDVFTLHLGKNGNKNK